MLQDLRYAFDPGLGLYEEYHPYGSSSYRAANSAIEVSAKRYRYIGKERDEETGLDHMGARYYAAWLGRWTAADPAGLVDGPGRYSYARDNPVRWVDKTGGAAQDPNEIRVLVGNEATGKVLDLNGATPAVRDLTPTEVEAGRNELRQQNRARARDIVKRSYGKSDRRRAPGALRGWRGAPAWGTGRSVDRADRPAGWTGWALAWLRRVELRWRAWGRRCYPAEETGGGLEVPSLRPASGGPIRGGAESRSRRAEARPG